MKVHLGTAALAGAGGWLNFVGLAAVGRPTLFPPLTLTHGPFDRMEDDGKTPWISDAVKRSVLERRRLYQPRKKDTLESNVGPPSQIPAPGSPQPTGAPAPGKP